jgi:type IV pilus assembly protein PilE
MTCMLSSTLPPRPLGAMSGFTLLEAMITVAIIAILATIAYPSYVNYVKRGHRAAAKTQVIQTAQWMERYRTANNTYAGASTQIPSALSQSPAPGNGNAQYSITINAPIANPGAADSAYLVEATPVAGGGADGK